MQYPVHIQQVHLSYSLQSLYVPQPNILQQQYLANKAANPETSFPYWARLWPSAIALANFIEANSEYVQQKNVLELAAGLGLPSLVAAPFASHVLCTDMVEEAMQIAAKSAAYNGLQNMHCRQMNWNEIDETITADTLLLSDVNYEPEAFETLWLLVENFLNKGTTILLATPQRLMAKAFVEKLLSYCTHTQTMEVTDSTGVHAISMYVLQLQK